MREMRAVVGAVALALGLAAVGGVTGCTSAKAEPLEVTYYYLPG
jgi:ABC-type glycerol-3-phosphate transport system substrate-binding protein